MIPHARVSIVILNWNGLEDTLECLRSVQRIDYANFELIVVDNGSADGSAAVVKARFPRFTLIETGKNLGYAEGNNVGVRYALANGADWVFILNNDTVVHPAVVRTLVDAGRHYPRAGVLGAKVYRYGTSNQIWYAGAVWRPNYANFVQIGQGRVDDNDLFSRVMDTDTASGCAMLVRADAFRQVGLFDPRFFLIFEESDWCHRARRSGYRCLFVPEAKVWHKVSASFGGSGKPLHAYFLSRNRLLWIEKNLLISERLVPYLVVARRVHRTSLRYLRRRFLGIEPAARLVMAMELVGVADYCRRQFGDCPQWVRKHLVGKKA